MTTTLIVHTQPELDAALADPAISHVLIDSPRGVWLSVTGSATVEAYGSATVRASGSATVRASGSATVHASGSATVEAYGSATVRASGSATVRASGSATVHASGSATVHAYGSATVRASGSATVHAGSHVAVHLHSAEARVTGGVVIDVTKLNLEDVHTWVRYAGVDITDGRVTLYKATGDDLTTGREYALPTTYTVGTELVCVDWYDDNECGGGLHLSPTPGQATDYQPKATRWLRCTADVADVRPIVGGTVKCKVRALRVEAEVDRFACELQPAVSA